MENRNNSNAVVSLILGLVSLVLGIFTGIPAIIFARRARTEIAETNENGAAFATVGRILGWISIIWTIIVIVLAVALFTGASIFGSGGLPTPRCKHKQCAIPDAGPTLTPVPQQAPDPSAP